MPDIIEAIDVHAHFGRFTGTTSELSNEFMSCEPQKVILYAKMAHIKLTIVSPLLALLPRMGGNPIEGNIHASKVTAVSRDLLQWVVVDPLKKETYTQATEMLKLPKCAGIKIHPEEHGYPITKYGREIFEFAAKNNAIIETHSGEQNSMPEDFARLANEYPEVKIIISHLGCGWDGDLSHQVRAIQSSKHGNLYTDTSSAQSIMPNLIEWAVKEIGVERILFGTDSPLYFAPMQRARIDNAELSDTDKKKILYENAVRLFGNAVKNTL